MSKKKQNQDINLDAILDAIKNSDKFNKMTIFFNNNNELKMRLAKNLNFDNENNNEKLIFSLEKAKKVLINDFLEEIELYFENLEF